MFKNYVKKMQYLLHFCFVDIIVIRKEIAESWVGTNA